MKGETCKRTELPGPSAKTGADGASAPKGVSYRRDSRELGIAKSTVAYHAADSGMPVDDRARAAMTGRRSRRLWAKGCPCGSAGAVWFLAGNLDEAVVAATWLRVLGSPHDELFVAGRKRSRGHLKARLQGGVEAEPCETCGISEWRGRPLSIQLHHVKGDGLDNRLSEPPTARAPIATRRRELRRPQSRNVSADAGQRRVTRCAGPSLRSATFAPTHEPSA